jgi:hypothetical protein
VTPTATEALRRPIGDPITGGTLAPDELDVVRKDIDPQRLILDIEKFKKKRDVNVRASVLSADMELSIEGAHQFTMVIYDPERHLWRSGALDYAINIEINDWWWRLARRRKDGDNITLTFEPRVISWLRSEKGRKKARRGKITRAEFIRSLVMGMHRSTVKFKVSELHKKQDKVKTDKAKDRSDKRDTRGRREDRKPGFDAGYRIPNIDGPGNLSQYQTNMAERVLDVGYDMGGRRKVLVMAMCTIYQESRFKTSATNNVGAGHFGLLQQDPRYWPATRDPETDSKPFFKALIAADKANPNGDMNTVIQAVQNAGPGEQEWATWRTQAEDIVDHYMGGGGSSSTTRTITKVKPYEFRVKHGENWYKTSMRLAQEVRWRLWTIRDTFHYHAEEDLFRQKALYEVEEGKDGIDWIDYDADARRDAEEAAVTCRMRMWPAAIGTVVKVKDNGGPAEGRYLVVSMRRSLFSQDGTITLRKPIKSLPEPANETVTKTVRGTTGAGGEMLDAEHAGWPIPKGTIIQGEHGTSGLLGFTGIDYGAPAGSPCISPVDGTVKRFSGHDPKLGAVAGAGGPLGWSVYIYDGSRTYYLTHMGSRSCRVGQAVKRGQVIGTVANYHSFGRPDHIHMGSAPGQRWNG